MTCTPGLDRLGWDERWAQVATEYAGCGLPGRVTGPGDDGVYGVACEEGLVRASLGGAALSALAADPDREPCLGDWGVVRHWPDGPTTLEWLLPRTSVIRRHGGAGPRAAPALAANVDVVAVLVPAGSTADWPGAGGWLGLRGRLAATHDGDTRTVVIVLGAQPAPLVTELRSRGLGVDVLGCDPATDGGLDGVRRLAPAGMTVLLLGEGGLASSLARAVAPSVIGRLAVIPDGAC